MKLGTETGSLMNHVYSESKNFVTPEVGMGATVLLWSDRHACTVIEWDANRQIVHVQEDEANRVDDNGINEAQTYEYTPNTDGRVHIFKMNKKDGKWVDVNLNDKTGRYVRSGSSIGLFLGVRKHYHDFSF